MHVYIYIYVYIYILVTYATTGSNNGLLPVQCQGIIWNNADILSLSVRPLGTKFSEISIKSWIFPLKKIHLKLLSIKYQPFCHSLCVLIFCSHHHGILFSVTWVYIFLVAKLVWRHHSSDITISAQASQIPSISTLCSAICSGTHQRKHQSFASLVFIALNLPVW